jgi:hypothetical protein
MSANNEWFRNLGGQQDYSESLDSMSEQHSPDSSNMPHDHEQRSMPDQNTFVRSPNLLQDQQNFLDNSHLLMQQPFTQNPNFLPSNSMMTSVHHVPQMHAVAPVHVAQQVWGVIPPPLGVCFVTID